jgi:preprotein translocase subunit SecE
MAARRQRAKSRQQKKENAILKYFRDTRSELRKVRWPTREQALALTRIVLLVTLGMAILLGALDLFFNWLLRGIVAQNLLYMVLGVVVVVALGVGAYLIGQGEEV